MIAGRLNGKFQILLTPSYRHPLLQFPELDLGTQHVCWVIQSSSILHKVTPVEITRTEG